MYAVSSTYGGVAQLARAFGSYPKCRWFKSDHRYHFDICGPLVKRPKTPPFHGGNRGSNPLWVTIIVRARNNKSTLNPRKYYLRELQDHVHLKALYFYFLFPEKPG